MKLLIVTQAVDHDDPNLGFFHRWIEEFAKHCESVLVLCLRKGKYDLPANVRVLSLGKERGASRSGYVFRFYKHVLRERKDYDAVFVHMNSEYLLLGGIFWRLMGKRIGLWHTHKSISAIARIGSIFPHVIMTASSESYRRKLSKLRVLGHGIDTERIAPVQRKDDGTFRIVSVGRISRIKGYGTLILAAEALRKEIPNIEVLLVGGPLTDDDIRYRDELLQEIGSKDLRDVVHLVGSVSHQNILPYLHGADVFVNCSKTGSLDKAVLEAMAAGVPVLTSNDGLRSALGTLAPQLMFANENDSQLLSRIRGIAQSDPSQRERLGSALRTVVVSQHSLKNLIPSIVKLLQ